MIPEDSETEIVLHLDEDDDEQQSDPMCVEGEQDDETDKNNESVDVDRDINNEAKLPAVPLHA